MLYFLDLTHVSRKSLLVVISVSFAFVFLSDSSGIKINCFENIVVNDSQKLKFLCVLWIKNRPLNPQ